MKAYINKRILSQSTLDSGEITPMMAILHRFNEPGTYNVTVFQGDTQTDTFTLTVDKNAPQMLNRIDVGTANCSCTVNPKTPTVFHAPKATKGYTVLVEKFEGTCSSMVFNNRNLQEGDIFLATLIRPGEYVAFNQQGAECRISISPLKSKRLPFTVISHHGISRPNVEPVQIECMAKSFKPEKINIQTAQPLTFMIKAPSRIKIEYQSTEEKRKTVTC